MDMEYNQIYALTKFGDDDYSLWELTMARKQIYEIRQHDPTVTGNVGEVFRGLRTVDDQSESMINFVLPHGNSLKLYTVDIGEDFIKNNRFNGSSIHGTGNAIIKELYDGLKNQGYGLQDRASFRDVDVISTLQEIVNHNTYYYQTDFSYVQDILRKAAEERNGNRNFFWMSRKNGTWCFPERNVYIRDTNAYNTWMYYGGSKSEQVKAFWIELKESEDGKVIGDIAEIDYQKHLDYLSTYRSLPTRVEVVFRNPNGYHNFDFEEYNKNWQEIGQQYGTIDRKSFLVDEPDALAYAMRGVRGEFWELTVPMDVESYVKRLDYDRLQDYGYTAGDMVLTAPLDAVEAVKHGLSCYALYTDGRKGIIYDQEDFQRHQFASGLYGMEKAEKQILQYLKQGCIPLFTNEEMRKICSLAVRAGMENEKNGNELLNSIIHKVEYVLPREEESERQLPEREALPCDILR